MDAKEKLQLQLIRIMSADLSDEQLNRLKNTMSAVMWDYSVNEIENTGISENTGDKSKELMQYYAVSKLACNTSKDTIAQYLMVVRQLCEVTRKPVNEITKIKLSCYDRPRDIALIVFLLETGIRVSECMNLDISDVDFDKREVKILGKGNKERIVYFTGKSNVLLKRYLDSREDINSELPCCCGVPLFVNDNKPHGRMSKSSIEHLLKKIGKDSGVTRIHPHLLRATFATELANKDMPLDMIAKLLGHANMNTLKYYVLRDYDEIQHSYRKIGSVA